MINSTLLILSSLNVTVCESEDCKNVANLFLSAMNKTADPCENFYEYVCGSWSNVCPVIEEFEVCNIDSEFEDAIKMSLRGILERNPSDSDSKALSKERKWYKACMNEERLSKVGYEPVSKHMKSIGGWPLIMNSMEWKEEDYPWQKVAQYYAQISGKYSLFIISQFLNPNNTENKIIMFDQLDGVQLEWDYSYQREYGEDDDFDSDDDDDYFNSFYSSYDNRHDNHFKDSYEDSYEDSYGSIYEDSYEDTYYYDEEEILELVISMIEDYAKSIGSNVENISHQVKEIFDFSQALYNLTLQVRNDERSKEKIVMTIKDFQNFYDSYEPGNFTAQIDWLEMIRTLLINSGTHIDESEKILVFRKSYFEKLVPLLKNTSNRIIVNFVHWVFFRDAIVYLDKDKRSLVYSDDDDDRWEYCIDHMMGLYFNTGFSQVFIENYFSDDAKEYANEIAEEVRNQVESDILASSWLNDGSKQLINEKLKSMKFHIGYPDYYKNKTFLDHIYDGLKVGPDYFENVINMLTFDNVDFWKEFREPFDKDQFLENPTILNAFYSEFDNSLTIPAAELLIPLFNSTMPLSIKYGYLGFTVGHEINHGFDNEGRKFDKNGNQLQWLTEELIDKYVYNAKCFINQFDDYRVNGTLTQNENIADSAGLKSAFQAYKKKMNTGNFKDVRLPGLNGLSGEQLFFVSFAASLCTSVSPEMEEYWIKNNEHSIEPHRVNGAVSNLKEFSKAFQCSENSPMNPKNKCHLWN